MGTNETNVLNGIVNKTQSDLIFFFIILTIVLVVVLLPLYNMMMKDRKEKQNAENVRQDKYIEREKQIIQVITANTEVMSGLKTALDASGATTNSSLVRVQERMDSQNTKIGEISVDIALIKSTLENAIINHHEIMEGINRKLMIVGNMSSASNFPKKGGNQDD